MFYLKKETIRRIIVTLRFSILSIFISLFLAGMLSLIVLTYHRLSSMLSSIAVNSMQEVSSTVFNEILSEIEDISIENKFAASLIDTGVIHVTDSNELTAFAYDFMRVETETLPSVKSLSWGDTGGNFVGAGKQDDGSIYSEVCQQHNLISDCKVLLYDAEGRVVGRSHFDKKDYDPRLRTWYQAAREKKKMIWTDVYSSQLTRELGIAVASPVFDEKNNLKGVLAVNVRLDFLSHFIESIRVSQHGLVFIVSEMGDVIAFPHLQQYRNASLKKIQTLPQTWIVKSFEQYQKKGVGSFRFHDQGQGYVATYQIIHGFNGGSWLIGVVAPEDDFISGLKKTSVTLALISLVVLLIGILLVSALVTRIVRPIHKLVEETQKIKNFELSGDQGVDSQIKEIIFLSDAIIAMKKGLRTFQKYIPASLVRQLIETGQEMKIGGEKRELVVLFSDIQNFTTVAERQDPSRLMQHMCDYFDALTRIITDMHGTIDKYIGDSVMAFWGAPIIESDSCEKAARAALRCMDRLNALNAEWLAQRKPALYTRFGIHVGDAIVGNVGSTERLSYTALGDTINIASRLENSNKFYGTHIMVSDTVYERLNHQFCFRHIDCVRLKGKEAASYIYELLAEKENDVPFNLKEYNAQFAKGFASYQRQEWDFAIDAFEECLKIYSKDTVAPVFIKRCFKFKLESPGAGWSGVWEQG